MRILVTGANGQVGSEVVKLLGSEAMPLTREGLDLSDPGSFVLPPKFDAIIHCAAYTAVDKSESEPQFAHAINAVASAKLADAAKGCGAKFLYVSTDYVFDGTKDGVYETGDQTNPQSVYGSTKLQGEIAVREILAEHFIVRTSWVFGKGNNFVNTMLRLACTHPELNVVCDQIGSPTYARDLAKLLVDMVKTEKYGTYHATNEGYCSWYEFACEIFRQTGKPVRINPIITEEYPTAAKRPANSRLSKRSLLDNGFYLFPSWQNALERYLENERH